MDSRPIFIACVALLVVACLCLCGIGIGWAGVYLFSTTDTSILPVSPLPAWEEPTQPEADSQTREATSHSAGEAIPPEVARQMDEIEMQVVLERGLKPSESVSRGLYSADQLRQRVLDDFLGEYTAEEAQTDAIVLAAFGLLNPNFDLYTSYVDLLSEQVAGFYDNEAQEMVVVQGEGFGGMERLTYAHEYTHALQDQTYDLENGLNYNDEACESDSERCAAIQALIEGDASFSEFTWFMNHATAKDQADIMAFYSTFRSPVYDSAPEFITLDFTFPYDYGYIFIETLHNQGGWGAVDRAYQNLPQSTEQILHPERYPDDTPIPVSLPDFADLLGNGWEELDRGVMGEWYTYLILAHGLDASARLADEIARTAAEGWGGDSYTVYHNPEAGSTAMVLHLTWDTPADAAEFAAAFRAYAAGRFGTAAGDAWAAPDGYHTFHHEGSNTTWVLAPDADTAAALWLAGPHPQNKRTP